MSFLNEQGLELLWSKISNNNKLLINGINKKANKDNVVMLSEQQLTDSQKKQVKKNLDIKNPGEVVKNYEIIEEIRDYYETQNKALQKTNNILRSKIDDLETRLEIEKNKNNSIEKVDNTSNLDLIKKIAKLESELFQTKQQLEEFKN